jgi:hypothetical protein
VSYPGPPGGPPPPGDPYPPQGPGPGNPYQPQGYSGPPPNYSSPPQWSPQQPPFDPSLPPKKRGNGWKWALGAVALLVVIGVTAAVTISVTRDQHGDGGPTPSGDTFGLASADDKGPANIITEDPSCAAWTPINSRLSDVMDKGWNQRDPAIPSDRWTPDQRAAYERVGQTLPDLADQSVHLAKVTPHRVMRELYEQFIAYSRAYSDAIPSYTERDDPLGHVVVAASEALTYVCSAVEWQSAQSRAPLIDKPAPPTRIAALSDPSDPSLFLDSVDPTCPDWYRIGNDFDANTKDWQALDANIAANDWNDQQRNVIDSVIPFMAKSADEIDKAGRSSNNPVIQDFAVLAAQYRRAYVAALPTYTPKDSFLATAALRITSTLYEACKAAEE